MKCERCGGDLGNKIIRINGVTLCENCAREVTREQPMLFNPAFPILDELSGAFMGTGLDFANTRITCPKCGSTLKDIETTKKVGCIECYNTFNETILKFILKRQGNSEYRGRAPGETIEIETGSDNEESESEAREETPKKAKASSETRRRTAAGTGKKETKKDAKPDAEQAPAPDKEEDSEEKKLEKIAKLNKADLGMMDDDALKDAMKLAVECEDYILAARLRDELAGRKGDK